MAYVKMLHSTWVATLLTARVEAACRAADTAHEGTTCRRWLTSGQRFLLLLVLLLLGLLGASVALGVRLSGKKAHGPTPQGAAFQSVSWSVSNVAGGCSLCSWSKYARTSRMQSVLAACVLHLGWQYGTHSQAPCVISFRYSVTASLLCGSQGDGCGALWWPAARLPGCSALQRRLRHR
jgi:hypothetical protein